MFSGLVKEGRATLVLALPLAAANVAQMAMGVTDTVLVGTLGAVPLAAVGLGAGFYFTTVVVCQGLVMAVSPLAAFAIGAGDRAAAGRIGASGLILTAVLAVPVIALMRWSPRLLAAIGYDPALSGDIGTFLRAIAWGAPGFIGFAALRSLLAALSRTRGIMLVLFAGIGTNAALNWAFIFGHLGLPAMGLEGSGYASAINQWLMFLSLAAVLAAMPRDDPAHRLRGSLAGILADIRRIVALGGPIAGLQGLEVGVFVTSAAVMGLFGADVLAAHQIAINFASITFMVPLGIGQAATVRVSSELGAGRPEGARLAAIVALALGTCCMALSAILMWTFARQIISAYIAVEDPQNRAVVAFALRFLAVAAVFQIVDGIQVVAVGSLRGYHDTTVPMVLAAIGYWAIGFAGGWLLAFPLGVGPTGLWWGFVLGLATVAAMLTARLLFRPRRTLLAQVT
jgi:MATE family multidrug resistance protein